jgi:hypothetical protein
MPNYRTWAAFFILCGFLYLCLSEAAPSQPSQKSTREGLQLLHKMQSALGGADKITAIRDYDETVSARTWDRKGDPLGEVRKRTRWMRSPNMLRLDQIGPRDTYVLYFDGASESGWEILPDVEGPHEFKTTGKAIALVGDELRFAKSYLSSFDLNMWLADRTPGYAVTSPAPNVLRIEVGGTATDFTLDSATWLPMKTAGVSLANPERPAAAEMRYGEWKEVAGVRFPTHLANYHNGTRLAQQTGENIRVNVGLTPQELAAKPADFAPDISHR